MLFFISDCLFFYIFNLFWMSHWDPPLLSQVQWVSLSPLLWILYQVYSLSLIHFAFWRCFFPLFFHLGHILLSNSLFVSMYLESQPCLLILKILVLGRGLAMPCSAMYPCAPEQGASVVSLMCVACTLLFGWVVFVFSPVSCENLFVLQEWFDPCAFNGSGWDTFGL